MPAMQKRELPKCSNNNQAARARGSVHIVEHRHSELETIPAPPPPCRYQFNPFNSPRAYPDTSTDGHRRFAETRGYIAICTAATINLLESITVLETDST